MSLQGFPALAQGVAATYVALRKTVQRASGASPTDFSPANSGSYILFDVADANQGFVLPALPATDFVVPLTGLYILSGTVAWPAAGAGVERAVYFWENIIGGFSASRRPGNPVATESDAMTLATIKRLVAGQTLRLAQYTSGVAGGTAVAVNDTGLGASTSLTIAFLGL